MGYQRGGLRARQSADVQPRCHTYTDTKLPWLYIPDGLLGFTEPEMPPVVEHWKAERS
jgi:hypothetical protein